MQNIQNYLNQLSNRDKILLFVSIFLFAFVFYKLLILNSLEKQNQQLNLRATLVQEQTSILSSVTNSSILKNSSNLNAGQIINNFLKKNNIAEQLKQIRTTSNGEQRFEIEKIQFNHSLELLNLLENNGSAYSSLQLKKQKSPGIVNLVITIPK